MVNITRSSIVDLRGKTLMQLSQTINEELDVRTVRTETYYYVKWNKICNFQLKHKIAPAALGLDFRLQ